MREDAASSAGQSSALEPGYYAVDFRRSTLGELARYHRLNLPLVLLTRESLTRVGRFWLPRRLSESRCQPEDLSAHFHDLARPHLAALAGLGFQVRVAARTPAEDDSSLLDSGQLVLLDSTRTQVASLAYLRVKAPPPHPPFERLMLDLRVELDRELLAVTDTQNAYDPAPGVRVVVVRDAPVAGLHRRLLAELARGGAPRTFASDDELMAAIDQRSLAAHRHLVSRGVYVRLGGRELADLPEVASPTPAPPRPSRRFALGSALTIGAASLVYQFARSQQKPRHQLHDPRLADDFCLKLLAEGPHTEARAWLAEDQPGDLRNIGEQTPQESRRIVDDLYRRGAVDVQAAKIAHEPGLGETTDILVVRLPEQRDRRRSLFAFEEKNANAQGFDGTPDDGQRYLFLWKFKATLWQTLSRIAGR